MHIRRAGCGDQIADQEFPSDKVCHRDDRGIVGVKSFIAAGQSNLFPQNAVLPRLDSGSFRPTFRIFAATFRLDELQSQFEPLLVNKTI
jgi:hypothetical protein